MMTVFKLPLDNIRQAEIMTPFEITNEEIDKLILYLQQLKVKEEKREWAEKRADEILNEVEAFNGDPGE